MAAQYDFWKKPVRKDEKDEHVLIPRMVSKGTIDTEQLIKHIAESSTFSRGDLRGALEAIMNGLVFNLRFGYRVEVGDLGFFSLKLKARPVKDPKEIHAQSVSVVNVNFCPSGKLRKLVRNISLERASEGFSTSSESDPEKRIGSLLSHLDTHSFITRKEYGQITGLLRNKAQIELNKWVEAGYIEKKGTAPHIVYIKKTDKTG